MASKETTTTTTTQPQSLSQMNVMQIEEQQRQCEHGGHKAWRLRGGGAAKDCFLGALACFLCCECCEGCCSIIGDIICCPCELIC